MAIFRIVGKDKKLMANVNKLEAINGILASQEYSEGKEINGRRYKHVWLTADNIPVEEPGPDWKPGDTFVTVNEKIDNVENYFNSEINEINTTINNLEADLSDYAKKEYFAYNTRPVAEGGSGHTKPAAVTALVVDPQTTPGLIDITQHTAYIDGTGGKTDKFGIKAGYRIGFDLTESTPTNPIVKINADTVSIEAGLSNLNNEIINTNTALSGLNSTVVEINNTVGEINNELIETNKTLARTTTALFYKDGNTVGEGATAPEIVDGKDYGVNTVYHMRDRISELENGLVKTVNGEGVQPGTTNIELTGANIKVSPTDELEDSVTIHEAISDLITKVQISNNEKVLARGPGGLETTLSLTFSNGRLELKGIDDEVLGYADLALGSCVTYSDVCTLIGGNWTIPNEAELAGGIAQAIRKAAEDISKPGQYLVLGFKDDKGHVNYTFTDLSSLIDAYSGSKAITIENNVIELKKDANSTYELQITNNGLLYRPMVYPTYSEFDNAFKSDDGLADGIYYIEE